LLLHLLPLLALIAWTQRALDVPRPIPIQLVIEQPPPPPPPPPPAPPKPETAPPPGRLASDDFGAVGSAHKPKSAEAETPSHEESAPPVAEKKPTPAASEPPAPAETTQTATLVPPPPEPPPSTVPETPPLDPLLEQGLPVAMPPPAAPPPKQMAPKRPAAPPSRENLTLPLPFSADSSGGAASARYPGPSATRDQYCAYALFLIMQHIDLLPRSLLGARRGYVTVTIQLRPDGTIVRAMAARGSGYLDIDERVVAMVKAVGRFPPLPLWVSTPVADFAFHMHFPDQSEH
jgi:TonB family protein